MRTTNYFGLGLALRLVALLTITLAFAFIFASQDWIFSQVVLLVAWLITGYETYRYVHYSNRKLSRFISGIRYNELDRSFEDSFTDGGFSRLGTAMRDIIVEMKQFKSRHLEEKTLLYSLLKSHTEGLMVYDESGKVVFENEHFCGETSTTPIAHWDQLATSCPEMYSQLVKIGDQTQGMFEVEISNGENIQVQFERITIDRSAFMFIRIPSNTLQNTAESEAWVNMVNVVNHEIKNGISPIISLADSLKAKTPGIEDERLQAVFSSALTTIRDQAANLTDFADDYRKLIKVPSPQKELVTWNALIKKVLAVYQTSFPEHLTWSLVGNALEETARVDVNQIVQVLTNLLTNALKATSGVSKPEIRCNVERDKSNFVVSFSDNGPGIEKAIIHQIFVPFFSTYEDGSGIGLSLSRKIIQNHGGTLRYIPQDTNMTTFRITIPAVL